MAGVTSSPSSSSLASSSPSSPELILDMSLTLTRLTPGFASLPNLGGLLDTPVGVPIDIPAEPPEDTPGGTPDSETLTMGEILGCVMVPVGVKALDTPVVCSVGVEVARGEGICADFMCCMCQHHLWDTTLRRDRSQHLWLKFCFLLKLTQYWMLSADFNFNTCQFLLVTTEMLHKLKIC
ncbi:hypothetical protein E2C01_024685 [Portunus trituberculatus]|uniref:Uncharacterized protein n=1 Tax=Portunus trituberculatus TaxID=210409 RepID=A0A5B7ED12_PORTR|nr:hypothetical protein [Portunus trituberculatus]